MHVSLTDAKAQLTDLVRRAEAGDEIILTRHGQEAVRLVPIRKKLNREAFDALIERLQEQVRKNALPGPDAAHCSDFLYDEIGLPK